MIELARWNIIGLYYDEFLYSLAKEDLGAVEENVLEYNMNNTIYCAEIT